MSCLSQGTIDVLKTLGVIKLSILDTTIKIIYTPSIPMLVNYFITKSFKDAEVSITSRVIASLQADGYNNSAYTTSIANIANVQVSCLYQDTQATLVPSRLLHFNYPFVSSDYIALHNTADNILYMNNDYTDVFSEVKEKLSDIYLSDYILAFANYVNEYKIVNPASYYSSSNLVMNEFSLAHPVESGFYSKPKSVYILPAIYASIFIHDQLVEHKISLSQALRDRSITLPSLCESSTKILNTMEVLLLATKDTAHVSGIGQHVDKMYREIIAITSKYQTLSFTSLDTTIRTILIDKFKSLHGDICQNM